MIYDLVNLTREDGSLVTVELIEAIGDQALVGLVQDPEVTEGNIGFGISFWAVSTADYVATGQQIERDGQTNSDGGPATLTPDLTA